MVCFIGRQEGRQLVPDGVLLPHPVSDGRLPGHCVVRAAAHGT